MQKRSVSEKYWETTTNSIISLLLGNIISRIAIANLIAWPLAYLAMKRWLMGFAYRIDMSLLMFPVVGTVILLTAISSITIQVYRAATENPVKALNSD